MDRPRGYIFRTDLPQDSFIILGELARHGHVSKGYVLNVPNFENASNTLKNDFYLKIVNFLSRLGTNKRVQFKYEKDANYFSELATYQEKTNCYATHKWDQLIREKTLEYFKAKANSRKLRREYLYVYVTTPLKGLIGANFIPEDQADTKLFESSVVDYFRGELQNLKESFSGCSITPMTHREMFQHYFRTLNKSALEMDVDYDQFFESELENCLKCDYAGETASPEAKAACFYADGYYHNVLTLTEFPKTNMYPFFGNQILQNSITNLSITVNLAGQDINQVILQKQRQFQRLVGDRAAEASEIALDAAIDSTHDQVYKLGQGSDIPFRIEYIVHIWSDNISQLRQDTLSVKNIVARMNASLSIHELGSQSLYTFHKTWPGNLYYNKWSEVLECVHQPLAALLPFNASFTGLLNDGMCFFDGDHGNIVGLSSFIGGTPQHAAMFGQSGAGKSVNMIGIISQTHCFYDKTVIIEDGASYLMLTKIYGGEFIVINPSANITLNYFDTCGIPLNPHQTSFVVALLSAMCGRGSDEEKIIDREAIITPYVASMYNSAFDEWKQRNFNRVHNIAREAMTIEFMIPKLPVERNTVLDAFSDLNELLKKAADQRDAFENEIFEYYSALGQTQLTDYISGAQTHDLLRDIAYAYMSREDMPTHSQLVEEIRLTPFDYHDKSETDRIANRLARYSISAGNGCLFDGHTTIDLTNSWLHIELGQLRSANDALRSLVGVIIDNLVKNQITSMKRSLKKMYIFEEAPRILTIKGADDIMKQSYAQFRKYNCVAVTITQAMAQLWESDVGTIICSQSKQLYLLKNKDMNDINKIAQFAIIPEETRHKITQFPSPEHMVGEKYSSFAYYADSEGLPVLGVVRHVASKEIIFAAATSGEKFSQREQQLKELAALMPDTDFVTRLLHIIKTDAFMQHKIFKIIDQLKEDQHIINGLKTEVIKILEEG